MKFREYVTAYEEICRMRKREPHTFEALTKRYPQHYFNSVDGCYRFDIEKAAIARDYHATVRLVAELAWHTIKRPYFNVYPLIEKKLLELSDEIQLSELTMPFVSMEVRTSRLCVLFSDLGDRFLAVVDFPKRRGYQELIYNKSHSIGVTKKGAYLQVEGGLLANESAPMCDELTREQLIYIFAGVCLLAKDPTIVSPVILNKHRKDNLTKQQMADLATKAISRTGRIGFEVGRDIERMKATAHYRNGCFAKYYVGKEHECYPDKCELSLAPIIKWRVGSVVNKDNLPRVPTGFRDLEAAR